MYYSGKRVSNMEEKKDFPKNRTIVRLLDSFVAFSIALVPILQHYIGYVDNAATTLLIGIFPYLLVRLFLSLKDFHIKNLGFAWALIVFFLFKLVDHGTSFLEIGQVGMMCFLLVCFCQNLIDTGKLLQTASLVAALSGLVLFAQYFCYYLLGFHLNVVPTRWFLNESSAWVLLSQTGRVAVTQEVMGLYRPSAFFMEPSHLFLYSFPCLFVSLFGWKGKFSNRLYSVLISIAMILSTSGMGIVITICAWGFFLAFRDEKEEFRLGNIFRPENWHTLLFVFILGCIAVLSVPFLRVAVGRVLRVDENGTFGGRTLEAIKHIRKMHGLQWVVGVSDTMGFKVNMPGFMATAYKYGLVGIVLTYIFYLQGLRKFNAPYFWIAATIVVVSFFSAHTHGTFFMIYYAAILQEGMQVSEKAWIKNCWGYTKIEGALPKRKVRIIRIVRPILMLAIFAALGFGILKIYKFPIKSYVDTPMLTIIDAGAGEQFQQDVLPLAKKHGVSVSVSVALEDLEGEKSRLSWEDMEKLSSEGVEVLSMGTVPYSLEKIQSYSREEIQMDFEKAKEEFSSRSFSGSNILIYPPNIGERRRAQDAASSIYDYAIKYEGSVANLPGMSHNELNAFGINCKTYGKFWGIGTAKKQLSKIARNGGWCILRIDSSTALWKQRLEIDPSGEIILDENGKAVLMVDKNGEAVYDASGKTPTVGNSIYGPILDEVITYAQEKKIQIVSAEKAVQHYFE